MKKATPGLQDQCCVCHQNNQNSVQLIVEMTNVVVGLEAKNSHDSLSVAPENWQPDEMTAAQVLVEQSSIDTTTGTAAARRRPDWGTA